MDSPPAKRQRLLEAPGAPIKKRNNTRMTLPIVPFIKLDEEEYKEDDNKPPNKTLSGLTL